MKPQGFEDVLADEEVCILDSNCKEPVYWGYKLIEQIGEQRFEELKKVSQVKFAVSKYPDGIWFVVSRVMMYQEALEHYGAVKCVEYGPRGGFKSITFYLADEDPENTLTFSAKELAPPKTPELNIKPEPQEPKE